MANQISHSETPEKRPLRHNLILNGSYVVQSNAITKESLFFLNGILMDEGLDGHYSVEEGRIDLHISNFKGSSLTILTL